MRVRVANRKPRLTARLAFVSVDHEDIVVTTDGTQAGRAPLKRFALDWGDATLVQGINAPLQTYAHTYAADGDYRIRLEIWDTASGQASDSLMASIRLRRRGDHPTSSGGSSAADLGGYRPEMPNAQGMATKGGRGTSTTAAPVLIKVTSLADSSAALSSQASENGMAVYTGEFRAAVQFAGPRFIVFETSGYIDLKSVLNCTNAYMTVAGQTAPAPGVCIRMTRAGLSSGQENTIYLLTKETVWQHVRVRPGDTNCNSGLQIWNNDISTNNVNNHLFDHVSLSWFQDDGYFLNYDASSITFWKSIIAEGMHNMPGSSVCSGGGQDSAHGLAIGWGQQLSVIQCLFANTSYRVPQIDSSATLYYANNVVYGVDLGPWYNDVSSRGPWKSINRGNYYKIRSGTHTAIRVSGADAGSELFLDDNTFDDGPGLWTQFVQDGGGIDPRSTTVPTGVEPSTAYTVLPSTAAYTTVLAGSGCRPKLRATTDDDGVDSRIIDDVTNRTGALIDSVADVGGYPTLTASTNTFSMPANPLSTGDAVGRLNLEVYLETLARAVEP